MASVWIPEYYNGPTHWAFIKANFYHINDQGQKYLTYEDVIKRAMQMYVHRDWYAYLFGADGQTCTDELVDLKVRQNPKHFARYSAADIEDIKRYCRGKVVFDCSGFIHSIYDAPDMNAAKIISICQNVTTDLASGVEASVLYKKGHIGQDVGHGTFIDCACELDTFRLKVIREYDWEKSGMLTKYCDYTGATND